jgi:hypothetical protein
LHKVNFDYNSECLELSTIAYPNDLEMLAIECIQMERRHQRIILNLEANNKNEEREKA